MFYSPDSTLHLGTVDSAHSTIHLGSADSADSTLHLVLRTVLTVLFILVLLYRADSIFTLVLLTVLTVTIVLTEFRVTILPTVFTFTILLTVLTVSITACTVSTFICRATAGYGLSARVVSVFQGLHLIQSVAYVFLDLLFFSIKHLRFPSRSLLSRRQPSQQCANLCDPHFHNLVCMASTNPRPLRKDTTGSGIPHGAATTPGNEKTPP